VAARETAKTAILGVPPRTQAQSKPSNNANTNNGNKCNDKEHNTSKAHDIANQPANQPSNNNSNQTSNNASKVHKRSGEKAPVGLP
jgi:hypothetical protein